MEESTSTLEKKPPGTIYDLLLTEASSESSRQLLESFSGSSPNEQLFESFIGIRHIASGQIKIGEKLGHGAFGKVYQGKWKNKLVALKKVDIKHAEKYFKKIYSDNDNTLRREHIIEILQWEIGRLSTAIHPNIVPFYGLYKSPLEAHTYMVMAFCGGGTLDSALAEKNLPWHKRWQWAREITRGLRYLHDKGTLHRDLKAENILIDSNGCARLADLGLAQADSLLIAQEAKLVALGVKDNRYIAPETFKNATVSTPATDVYALGLVFWQLVCGKRGEKPQPRRLEGEGFNGNDEKEWMEREPIPKGCPTGFEQLILSCWALDPQQRPTAKVVLEVLDELAKDPNIAPPALEILTLCDKLTLLVQEKPLEGLNYLPPFLTAHRLVKSVEGYWKSWENSPKAISFSNPPLNLFKTLHNFVKSKTATSLLLLGEAGSGKTLSIYLLADALLSAWYAYMNAPKMKKLPAYFPLFVRPAMSAWTQAALQKEGFERVLNYYGLPKHAPFGLLLILDGYDECQPGDVPIKNLSLHLGVPDNQPVKLIITCRPNTVPLEKQRTYFAHRGELQIRHFLGFKNKQLLTSLSEGLGWNETQENLFMEAFAQAPELSHILRNPFVLHLFVESFEALKDKDLRTLKRWQIYDAAVSEWLRKNQALLNLDVRECLADSHTSLKDSFDRFAGYLAFTAFRQKKLGLTHEEAEKGEFLWAQLPHLVKKEGHNSFVSYTLALYRFEGDMLLSEKDKLIWCNKQAKEKNRKLPLPALIQWYKKDEEVPDVSGIKRASSAGGLEGYSVYGLSETGECQLTPLPAEILPADLDFSNGDGKKSLLVSPAHHPGLYDTLQSLKAHCKKAERRSLLSETAYLEILIEKSKQFSADCPLKVRLEGYEFIHKSFFEYFAARYLLTLCHLPPEEIQNKATELLADRHLTTEPEILAFWIEGWQVSDYEYTKTLIEPLFAVIASSKNCSERAMSASNAATLLAKVRVPFVNKDLQGIHIPEADLSRAVFSLSNFSRANLRGVNFRATCLAGVNFTEADMTGVKFGEWATLKGAGKVRSICYSPPDGRYLVIAEGKDIGIFEKSEGDYERIHTLTGHTKLVTCVAYSPDGSQLASGSDDKTVRQWDVKSGKPIQTLTEHTHFVNSVAYSPDGSQLVSGSWDKTVRKWDVKSGKALQTLMGHTSLVTCVAYSPDGNQLASGSWDKTVRQWDVKSGKALQTLTGHTDIVKSVTYSPDGSQLASGSSDNTVRQWDVKSGETLQTLTGHASIVECVAYSPDGSQLASGSSDNTVRQWDVKSGKPLQTLTGHTSSVRSVVYSPDGSQLASGSDDNTVRQWDVKSGKEIQTLTRHTDSVRSVAYSPDGSQLASGNGDKTVRQWDVKSGKAIQSLKGHKESVKCVAYSPDGSQLVSGSGSISIMFDSEDNTVCQWDVKSGKAVQTLTGHTDSVSSVAYSPNGSQLASGSSDNTVRQWDVKSSKAIQTLKGHTSRVICVAYSPDGSQLASGSEDTTIYQWGVKSGKAIQTLKGHVSRVNCVAYSPDGSQLASGSSDKTVRQWDVKSGKVIHTLAGHTSDVYCIVYSPDSSQLASGSGYGDNTVRLWNVKMKSGKVIQTLTGHTSDVYCIAYSPDGSQLASGSYDGAIFIWQRVETILQGERWIIQYRLSNDSDCVLLAQEAILHNTIISKSNVKLLEQRGAIADYNYDEAIHFNPEYAIAYYNRGLDKANLGQYEAAVANFNEALRLNPKGINVYCSRGLIKYNLGRYEEAIADYNQVLVVYPNDMFCLLGKAFCYLFQNNLFLAKALFQQVIEQAISTNNDDIMFMQKYSHIGLFFIEWVTQEERQEIVESSFYEMYTSFSSPSGKIELSCSFLSRFFLHAVESKYVTNPNKIGYTLDKIILFMEKVTESLPNEFLPPYYMAKLLLLKGEMVRAKDFLSLSLKISPQNTLAIKLNAFFETTLLRQAGIITSEPSYNYFNFSERSSQIFAGFFTVFSDVGRKLTWYLNLRDRQAIGCMNRSSYAFFKQEDAKRLYQQARVYWDSKAYQQAIQYFHLAAKKGHAEAQFNLGICYQQGLAVAQDLIKAVDYYQKASQQGHANAWNNLAHLLKAHPELSVSQTEKSIQFE